MLIIFNNNNNNDDDDDNNNNDDNDNNKVLYTCPTYSFSYTDITITYMSLTKTYTLCLLYFVLKTLK